MTLGRLRVALGLLLFFASFSTAWSNERPILEVRDGNLFITSAKDRNITLQTVGSSNVNINGINVLNIATSARDASQLVERWKLGTLADMEQTLRRLAESIEGPSGLQSRVNAIEWGAGSNRTTINPGPSGNTGSRSSLGFDGVARSRIQRLTARVRQAELEISSLRRKLETDECASNPCQNGGTCEDRIDGYKCLCTEGWEGPQCNTDVNECARYAGTDLGCQNGATCRNLAGTYQCDCAANWHGIHCTKATNDCNTGNTFELCGHGTCVNKGGPGSGFTCICDQGWKAEGTNPACIIDVDECASKHPPCSVNPMVPCINVPGTFYCGGCPQGYTGNGYYCADIDECAVNNGGCSIAPSVQCINTMGSRLCAACPPGYQGDGVTCSYFGPCANNNGGCHPLATCVNNPGMGDQYVQCRCPSGYQGTGSGPNGCTISTDLSGPSACTSNPCSHGTCIPNGPHDYTCRCDLGYTGRNCEGQVNPCDPNPCKNRGTCSISIRRTALCRCTADFSGPRCGTARQSCGGIITDPSGTLQFPSDGNTYQHGLSCAWLLNTNSSSVLNVTFSSFNLEQSADCKFDFLQIHDGRTAGEHLIGKYCGNSLPAGGNIISTHHSLYMWFHSDNSVSRDGFTLQWNSIDPQCGGEIIADHGTISSPGSPGRYPLNRDCNWYVSVTAGKRIQFHFFTMMLEEHPTCGKDYLEIKDGPSESSQQLEIFCNHTHPPPLTTSGSEAWLHFHSDSSGQDAGFQITFSSVEGLPGCGGIHTAPSGQITSPNFGTNYEPNMDCEWKIQLPRGERVRITWATFELEQSRGCRFDFVKVFDGINREAPLIGRYCGTTLPPVTLSSSNVLLIQFKSDWSYNNKGFKLNYAVLCDVEFTAETGVIKSPYYPNPYPASRTCIYEIIQPPGKAIQLTIRDMDIEGFEHHDCYFDFLEVHDGDNENSTMLGKYCGGNSSIPDFPIMSTHNYLWLKFETDGSIHQRGFMATYETVDRRCGGLLKTPSGIIQSPSENGRYSNREDCTWVIQATPGFVVQLNWLTFDLEYEDACYHDYVQISENMTSTSEQYMGKYCGTTKPPILTTQSRIMTIRFHTDFSVTRAGFVASYIFIDASNVCGGHYSSVTGTIKSPNYPDHYPENRVCEWVIEAPNKHQVALNVKKFDIEEHSGCSFDYLEIRNGGSETSPLVGKYCGANIPTQIKSFGNQIYLKFKTDISRSGEGFNIEWDSSIIGCGGTLTSPSGSIFSPNYPQPYSRSAECNWQIAVSAGSVIELVIVDLDLEDDAQCGLDFIEIYEGPDRRGKKLGRYCESNHPLNIATTSNVVSVRFRSDYSFSGRGFQINYHTVCHNRLRGFRGVIESPNFPNKYPDRENCSWIIEAPMGNKLNLTFSHFDLEAGDTESCSNDYLEIKEGENDVPNKILGKFCDSTALPPKIVSGQNQVFLQFLSDLYVANNGFRLEWVVNGCGGRLTKPYGTITSPGYPNAYPKNIDCEWSIEVDYSHSINITLVDVNLERTQACAFDKLIMYSGADETAPKLIETCHSNNGSTFTSTGNKLFVKFHADYSFQSSGFKITYRSVDIQCGGRFTTSTGVIHSTNYPNSNYPPTQNCEWLIQVPVNHLVNLTFLDFDIEASRNCTYDYVRIYDGSSRDAPVLGSHCHNTLPPSYISSSNELLVVMRTDSSLSAKGFKASYDVACGARIVTNDQGILSMDSTVGLHSELVNCTWTIIAQDPEDHVTLTLTEQVHSSHFWLDECEASSLQVFEGEGTDGPSLGTWCSTKVPPPITSQGNALTIHVTSLFGSLYETQFSGTYSVLNSACGGTYTSEHGTIATPGYPNSYPRNIECVWYLQTSPGNRLSLSFKEFDLIESEHCNLDYVEVREVSGIGKLIGAFCGKNVDAITSAKSLWVKFRSSADTTKKGFVADYSLLHGGDLSGPSGEIASPLYPKPCMLHGEYFWRIIVDSASSLEITFKDFHIPQYGEACYLSLTIYDGYDENAPELMDKCGVILPEPVRSSSNIVYIKLTATGLPGGSWFLLSWLQVPRESTEDVYVTPQTDCGGIISLTGPENSTYTFNSPGWPNGYDNNVDCTWTFETLPGSHLSLKFQAVDLEETADCIADQVQVFSGNSQSSQEEWSQLGSFCYPNSTRTLIEATDLMKVSFHSDVYINKTGFKAIVRKVCGGQLYGPNGVIETNHTTPTHGFWSIACQWNVTVRPGRTIEVKLIDINIGGSTDTICSNNYLMLKNGGTASSPILGTGKYCGNVIPNPLQTTGNQLYVKVSGSRDNTRFKLTYREVGMDCGGEIVLTQAIKAWDLKTPNYPNIPSPHSECFWTIVAPAGEPIMIHFIERFDLTKTVDCDREYLEIRDGGTDSAMLIGQFCGDVAPSSQTTTGNIMYLHFYTDVPDPKNGFQARVSIGDHCGGIIRDRKGTLKSANYPAAYPTNITCTWRIIGPVRHNMKLQFRDLDLPSRSYCGAVDHVDITEELRYNGTGELTPRQIGQYCGNTKPGLIQSSGNVVQVTFVSDARASANYRGFNMNFTTSFETCGGILEATEGEFSSPGYPNVRSHLRYCEWRIRVPDGYRIKIDILDFDLGGEVVAHPYAFSLPRITFYNDFNFGSRIKNLQASSTDRQILSTSNTMMIWYFSDSSAHRGFKARYSSIAPALCGGAVTSDQGTLIDNQNTVFNLTSFFCDWKVNSPWNNSTSQTLAITVSGTIGSSSIREVSSSTCRHRSFYVGIHGGENIAYFVCGNLTRGLTIRSPSPITRISALKGLNNWSASPYFNINYRWHKCGGILGGSAQTISAPKNLTYPLDCTWYVKFPDDGEGIALTVKKLNLGNCDTNYILVRKGSLSSPTVEKLCGSISKNITSTTNQLSIEYHAESPNNEFEIQVDTVQGGCGGLLTRRSGVISSPGFPAAQYPNNAECSWVITVENGFHIGLVFIDRFDLETSDNCANDFIQISYWQNDVHTGTAQWVDQPKLCGRNSPPPINSTSNRMRILFRSNDRTQADGFRAKWNVNCGGTLLVSKEVKQLSSPGWPRRYADNLFCNYTFVAPGKDFIVKFTDFRLEGGSGNCPYDNVSIITSEYAENPVWCHENRPPVQRADSRLELHFKTDEYIHRSGFRLLYYLDECGGHITRPSDIGSPSMDGTGSYYERINCTWTVQAPDGKAVVLRFETFHLEFSTLCYYDYVNVYSGLTIKRDERLASLCGRLNGTLPVVRSENGSMTINFVTDRSFNYDGFTAKILFTTGVAGGCGGQIHLSQNPFQFKTQRGSTYESLEDCHWVIQAPSNNAIILTITDFDLKNATSVTDGNHTRRCSGDYLEIRDGQGPFSELIGIYCGTVIPPQITTSTNSMWIRLVTDAEANGRGVTATLEILESPCGNATLMVGNQTQARVLTSPQFPTMYSAGLKCRWTLINSDPTRRWNSLTLHFLQFDLENSENCMEDKLSISNTDGQNFVSEGFGKDFVFSGTSDRPMFEWTMGVSRIQRETYTYCGNALPSDFYSSADNVVISFKSSQNPKSSNHTGFKLEYSMSRCNRNFTSVQGRIRHEDITDCWFTITAAVGQTISLYFNEFSVYSPQGCTDAGLQVRDGDFSSSTLAELCGMRVPNPIFSSGNKLSLHSWTQGSFSYQIYDITYTTTDKGKGCGGKLYNFMGRFTSPSYPGPYRNISECTWEVTVPIGFVVELQFTTFDLGVNGTCDSDYLKIYDVPSQGDALLATTYCGEDSPATYHSAQGKVLVKYTTSMNNGGSGWVIDFVAQRHETWAEDNVNIDVPNFDCVAKFKRKNVRAAGVAFYSNTNNTNIVTSNMDILLRNISGI